jgi:hypothetical protein
MDDAVTRAPHERGWRRLVLAVAAALLFPLVPPLRVLVPVERMIILVVPALAACAIVGWWRGGRFGIALAWGGIAAWLAVGLFRTGSAFDRLSGGWAVLVAGLFGLVLVFTGVRSFLGRALVAVGLAIAATMVTFAIGDGTAAQARRVAEAELNRRAAQNLAQWNENVRQPQWRDLTARNPELAEQMDEQMRTQFDALPGWGTRALPALLALETLAALGLAWALYHRLSRARLGPPLARLREFRFNDQLVWGLVVGITLLVLPAFAEMREAGINLIVFFGALYLLRGFGVLTWFLAPRGFVMALLFGATLFLAPLVGAVALWFGLGDTWFDWRSRPRSTT